MTHERPKYGAQPRTLIGYSGNKKGVRTTYANALRTEWWSWRELNPRPQAFIGQIYMFSDLF